MGEQLRACCTDHCPVQLMQSMKQTACVTDHCTAHCTLTMAACTVSRCRRPVVAPCRAAVCMSFGVAARLCMLPRWNSECLRRHPDVPVAAVVGSLHACLGEQVVISSRVQTHVSSYRFYGRDVGAPVASVTLIAVHTGHGVGASAHTRCSACGAIAQPAPGVLQAAGLSRFRVKGSAPLPVNNPGKIVKPSIKALLLQALTRHSAVSEL
jgi:hypothetical protein